MTNNTKIKSYQPGQAAPFRSLNLAWIQKYFQVEPEDENMLGDPEQYILQKGGNVFFATYGEHIAGTFALIPSGDREYELAKMAVAEAYQGKKIGHDMIAFCIDEAKRLGAEKIVLFSNTLLQPAIHLYKKFGFREVPLQHSAFKRSNIKMELDLKV